MKRRKLIARKPRRKYDFWESAEFVAIGVAAITFLVYVNMIMYTRYSIGF